MVSSHLQIALTVGHNSVFVSLPFYVVKETDPPPTNIFFFKHKTTNKVQTLDCPRVTYYHGVKESWSGCTGVAVLPKGDIGGPQGFLVTLQGCNMRNTVLFTQEHLCMVKSHIL